MTTTELNKRIKNLEKTLKDFREFDGPEVINLIYSEPTIPMSWGINNLYMIGKKMLKFNVQGFKFKGSVIIMLNSKDLFEVLFISSDRKQSTRLKDIYNTELVKTIDDFVEMTDNYDSKVSHYINSMINK